MSISSFGFEVPEDSPGFLLWQTTMSWQRLIKKSLDQYDISHAQFVIMAQLLWFDQKKTVVTQIDIVKMSRLDKMTVSKSLKKLVNLKYVNRQECIEDTRAKMVGLTSKGKALTRKLVPMIERIDAVFFGHLGNKEQQCLISALRQLATNQNE